MLQGTIATTIKLPRDLHVRVSAITKREGGGLMDFFRVAVEERVKRLEEEFRQEEARRAAERAKRKGLSRGGGPYGIRIRKMTVGETTMDPIESLSDALSETTVNPIQVKLDRVYAKAAEQILAAGNDKSVIKQILQDTTMAVKRIAPLRTPSDETVVRAIEKAIGDIQLARRPAAKPEPERTVDERVGAVIDAAKVRTWGDSEAAADSVDGDNDETDE